MDLKLGLLKQHPAWPVVTEVCRVLNEKGHKAYLAGGCVRDGLIGRIPKDFDVATDAEPNEVESYFSKTIDVGKAFGTIIVNQSGHNVEVTTFREDGPYTDGRHPDAIQIGDEVGDAKRRDFTINGLFYDIKTHALIDHVKGTADIGKRIIRAIGDPVERFKEDRLRTVRAIRFAAELDFEIDEKTWKSLLLFRSSITKVSRERISDELRKLLLAQHAMKGLILLKESQYLAEIWPSLSFLKSELYTKWLYKGLHILTGQTELSIFLSLILLLEVQFEGEHVGQNYKIGMDKQLKALLDFRYPREVLRSTTFCLKHFPEILKMDTHALILLSEPYGVQLLTLLSVYKQIKDEDLKPVERFRERYLTLSNQQGLLPDRFITGEDIEKLGLPHGPMYAEIIETGYKKQLDGEFTDPQSAGVWLKERVAKLI